MDGENENCEVLSPIAGLFPSNRSIPESLSASLSRVAHKIPSCATFIKLAHEKARKVARGAGPGSELPLHMSAAIVFYTIEAIEDQSEGGRKKSPYYLLNEALRAKSRDEVKLWSDYIWLLLNALKLLPAAPEPMVFRGMKRAHVELDDDYSKEGEPVFHGFTSTATTIGVMKEFVGDDGPRTIMTITLKPNIGRDVRAFSLFENENEVLLPPNVRIQVEDTFDAGHGLTMVQCKQIDSDDEILPLNRLDASNPFGPSPPMPTGPSRPLPSVGPIIKVPCTYRSQQGLTSRVCTKRFVQGPPPHSKFCPTHTCGHRGCFAKRSSKEHYCDQHTGGSDGPVATSPAVQQRLCDAIKANDSAAVQKLMDEHNADPSTPGIAKPTFHPMYLAAQKGHSDIVTLLIEAKANPNQATIDEGRTALLIAAKKGHQAVVKLLLEYKADPNKIMTDEDGLAPLHLAVTPKYEHGAHVSVVKMLLQNNANPNLPTSRSDKRAPLSMHLMNMDDVVEDKGRDDIVKLLLRHKADVNAVSIGTRGQPLTALKIANVARPRLAGIADLLQQHGATTE